MKELIESNKWLAIYLVVTIVSVLGFSLFVQSQGSDASERKKAQDAMQRDVTKVNTFSTKSVYVSEKNLASIKASLDLAESDVKRLKGFLSSNYSYKHAEEFKSLNRLQVKQKLIERVGTMKKSLREGDVYYDKDTKFGFEKYVNGIPAAKDALKLEAFSALTYQLLKIASAAKVSEVLAVKSTTGIELKKSLVGKLAKYSVSLTGTGQSVKEFLEGLKASKEFFVVINKLDMAPVEAQVNDEYDPTLKKRGSEKSEKEEETEGNEGVQQAAIAFVKSPVLKLDLEINLYLVEEK